MSVNTINTMMPALPQISQGSGKVGAWEEFSTMLTKQIQETSRLQGEAKDLGQKAMLGNAGVSLHEAQAASAKAEVHLKFLMQVRNKAVEVYREIMNMPA